MLGEEEEETVVDGPAATAAAPVTLMRVPLRTMLHERRAVLAACIDRVVMV